MGFQTVDLKLTVSKSFWDFTFSEWHEQLKTIIHRPVLFNIIVKMTCAFGKLSHIIDLIGVVKVEYTPAMCDNFNKHCFETRNLLSKARRSGIIQTETHLVISIEMSPCWDINYIRFNTRTTRLIPGE